jgi:hypothetical protein
MRSGDIVAYRFSDRTLTDVADLMRHLEDDERQLSSSAEGAGFRAPAVWFRGLEDASYKLIPTFHLRGFRIVDEVHMMNLFKPNAHEFVSWVPSSEWEWMFLMRHHGLPSRLLDWSESPLVGLFFAVCPDPPDKGQRSDGVLWCLLPGRLNELTIHWPPNSLSLPMFTEDSAEFSLPDNEALLNYLPSRLRQVIPSRRRTVRQGLPPAAGISVRTTRRMQAQLGVFTIHHADKTPLERVVDQTHVWRYLVPASRKGVIREELRRVGISRRTVFPDLDNVAREACGSFGAQ